MRNQRNIESNQYPKEQLNEKEWLNTMEKMDVQHIKVIQLLQLRQQISSHLQKTMETHLKGLQSWLIELMNKQFVIKKSSFDKYTEIYDQLGQEINLINECWGKISINYQYLKSFFTGKQQLNRQNAQSSLSLEQISQMSIPLKQNKEIIPSDHSRVVNKLVDQKYQQSQNQSLIQCGSSKSLEIDYSQKIGFNQSLQLSKIQKIKEIQQIKEQQCLVQIKQQQNRVKIQNQHKKQNKLYEQKRLLDYFNFQQKKQIFLELCRNQISSKKKAKNKFSGGHNYLNQLFTIFEKKNLLIELIKPISQISRSLRYFLMPCIIIFLMYDKEKMPKNINRGKCVQNKLKQFQLAQKEQNLEKCISENRQNFVLDSQNLTPQENFILFQILVLHMCNQQVSIQLYTLMSKILKAKEPNEQQKQNMQAFLKDFFYLEDNDTEYQLNQSCFKDKIKDNNFSQSTIEPIQFKNQTHQNKQLNIQLKAKYIVQQLNKDPEFNGSFYFTHQLIAFSAMNKYIKINKQQNIDRLISLQYSNLIQSFTIPMRDIRTQGLHKICSFWTNIKKLYIWDCHIESLEGSALQKLKKIQVLSLSNNPLKKDSVDYLIQHQWKNLTQLRISFQDGSQSYDILIPKINKIFPSLKQLYVRNLINTSNQTFISLLNLRIIGIFVFFRIQKQLFSKIINEQIGFVDVQGDNDIAHFVKICSILSQNQQRILQNQQKVLQNQKRILQNQKRILCSIENSQQTSIKQKQFYIKQNKGRLHEIKEKTKRQQQCKQNSPISQQFDQRKQSQNTAVQKPNKDQQNEQRQLSSSLALDQDDQLQSNISLKQFEKKFKRLKQSQLQESQLNNKEQYEKILFIDEQLKHSLANSNQYQKIT